jgi:histidinol-phosphate phosphatase family protein
MKNPHLNAMTKAVFLDRDGVIIEKKKRYLTDISDFKILPDVPELLKQLHDNDFKLIIITNQSAIAKGLLSVNDLETIHNKLQDELSAYGFKLDRIYHCAHSESDSCACRKPKIGLFKIAVKEFSINVQKSWLIGDEDSDIEAGRRLGCKTIKLDTNDSLKNAVSKILNDK